MLLLDNRTNCTSQEELGRVFCLSQKDGHPVFVILRFIGILLVSLSILVSNIINFIVLRSTNQIPATAKVWLTNLSSADFLLGMVVCLPCIVPAITGEWPYGIVWCQIAGAAHGTCATVSIWSLAVLSIDRCTALWAPIKYRTKVKPQTCARVCACLWVASFLSFIIPNIFSDGFVYYHYYPPYLMCGLYWKSLPHTLITGALVPYLSGVIILTTSMKILSILRKLKRIRISRAAWSVHTRSVREEKAAKLIIATTLVYFLAWGPYMLVCLIVLFIPGGKESTPVWMETLTVWLANSNSFVNVIIYSTIYHAFRIKAKLLVVTFIGCGYCRSNRKVGTGTTSDPVEGNIRENPWTLQEINAK